VDVADVSVVVRTIGRPTLLKGTLESLARCNPAPGEVLVVDQSDDLASEDVIAEVGLPGARMISSRRRGHGIALNEGFEEADHPFVLVTDDDCTVRSDWVRVGENAMNEDPSGIISGQVLPGGDDPRAVPSTLVMDEPRDYTGEIHFGPLFGCNMGCPRDAVLEMGGFDELIYPGAEDCDFCYRWLSAGRPLRHVPEFVIWHLDWRGPDELSRLYVDYARSRGMFYAKHLLAGDRRMLRYLAGDYIAGFRGLYRGWIRGVPRWADESRGVFAGVPRGLWSGWRTFGPARRGRMPSPRNG
jgi:GT2 family glycosyltransferase